MKRTTLITALVTMFLGFGVTTMLAAEKKAEPKKQTTCPVMGGKINKAQFVDVKGYRIYVCCAGCTGKIKADPDKYIKILKKQGVELEKAPKKEKGDKPVEKKTSSEHKPE